MSTFIFEIATTAARILLDPVAFVVPALAFLALVTGFAGRIAVAMEDLRHARSVEPLGIADPADPHTAARSMR